MLFKKYIKSALNLNYVTHLIEVADHLFEPKLSSELNVLEYAAKLQKNANCLLIEENEVVLAFVFYYVTNEKNKSLYISLICSMKPGLGRKLYDKLIVESNAKFVKLEVHEINSKAIAFYEKLGFLVFKYNSSSNKLLLMHKIK